jgi:hypothetical protein
MEGPKDAQTSGVIDTVRHDARGGSVRHDHETPVGARRREERGFRAADTFAESG